MQPRLFKKYVSEADQFLQDLDKTYPQKAEAWLEELHNLQKIFNMRDKLQYLHGDIISARGLK